MYRDSMQFSYNFIILQLIKNNQLYMSAQNTLNSENNYGYKEKKRNIDVVTVSNFKLCYRALVTKCVTIKRIQKEIYTPIVIGFMAKVPRLMLEKRPPLKIPQIR